MGVEPGGKQNRIRPVIVDDPPDLLFNGAQILRVAGAFGKRDVFCEAAAFPEADFIRGAGAGIKRIAVHRRVVHVIALFEQMLRAVSMMHIEIEDEHALDTILFAQPLRDAGDRVEKTETHRLNAFRVMSGRPCDDERPLPRPKHVVRGAQRGGHGRTRGGERLRGDRIVERMEQAHARAACVIELGFVIVRVDPGDDAARVVVRQRLANDLRGHPRPPHALDRRVDARGVFRMSDSRVVFVEDRMRVNVHGPCSWYNSAHLSRILRITLIVVLTAVFLALFLWNSNLRDVWRILLTTNPMWFAIGLMVNGSALIFRTIRWRILLSASDPPAFYPTFLANAVGYMLSTVLPIRAGDVARPALLCRRTRIRFSEALGTVLTERVLDLLSILGIFLFFCAYRWREFNHPVVRAGAYTAGAMLAGVAVILLAFRFFQNGVRRLHTWLGGFLPQRFREPWMRFFDAFAATLRITERPPEFLTVLAATACIWFCLTSQFWFVLVAAHRPLPWDSSMFLNAATTVGIAIPTPGGIGGFHKVCQWVLTTFYGFDIDTSVAVAVLFQSVGSLPVV